MDHYISCHQGTVDWLHLQIDGVRNDIDKDINDIIMYIANVDKATSTLLANYVHMVTTELSYYQHRYGRPVEPL